jgi:hypothetical protein
VRNAAIFQTATPRRLSEALVVLLLALWAFTSFSEASRNEPYFLDEAAYLARGRYFFLLFVERNLTSPIWREGGRDLPNIHSQPMFANYVVGAALWLAGEDPERFARYRWQRSFETNQREGRVPDHQTLLLVRQPMVWLATAAMLLLYALGRHLANPLAGVVAAAIGITSSLAQSTLAIIHNEAPLAAFMLLALLLALLGARRGHRGSLPLRWALLTGLALGLAFESKLSSLLSLAATLGWGGLVGLAGLARADGGPLSAWRACRGWLVAVLMALVVFVALNPHLWTGPLEHTLHLFELRDDQLRQQQIDQPGNAISLAERPWRVLDRSLVRGTWAGARGLPLEALAVAVGIVALSTRVVSAWRYQLSPPAEGVAWLTIVAYFVGIGLTLPLDWARYYLPTFLFGALLGGLGAGATAEWLRGLVARTWRRPLQLAATES